TGRVGQRFSILRQKPEASRTQTLSSAIAIPCPTPIARILGGAAAAVPPRVMGVGPIPASRKLMARLGMTVDRFDVIEINEAFASQVLAVLRALGIS
ncbi:hypothetical protein AB9F41_33915, partial [Rhizobium leguminosarum]